MKQTLVVLFLALPCLAGPPEAVQWYGTWRQGATEARRLNRPIFLFSAAPQCHGTPGVW